MLQREFETDRLKKKGIQRACIRLSLEGYSQSLANTHERLGIESDAQDVIPFRLSVSSVDDTDRMLGLLDGVYMVDYEGFGTTVYIYTLFTEQDYEGCGIATQLLDQAPSMVGAKFGTVIRLLALAPIPLAKDDETAKIVQEEDTIRFLADIISLNRFYRNRGFIPGPANHLFKFIKGNSNDTWSLLVDKLGQYGFMEYELAKDMRKALDMTDVPIGIFSVEKKDRKIWYANLSAASQALNRSARKLSVHGYPVQ